MFHKTVILPGGSLDFWGFFLRIEIFFCFRLLFDTLTQIIPEAWGQGFAGVMKSISQILELTYLNPCSCFSGACTKPSYKAHFSRQIRFPRTGMAPSYRWFMIVKCPSTLVTILCLDHFQVRMNHFWNTNAFLCIWNKA